MVTWPDRTTRYHERKREVVSAVCLIAGHQRLTIKIETGRQRPYVGSEDGQCGVSIAMYM